jgi:hypothetical protein
MCRLATPCDEIAHGLDPRIAGRLMPLVAQFNRRLRLSFASRLVEEVVTVGTRRNQASSSRIDHCKGGDVRVIQRREDLSFPMEA